MANIKRYRFLYIFLGIALVLSLLLSAGCAAVTGGDNPPGQNPGTVDDWQLNGNATTTATSNSNRSMTQTRIPSTTAPRAYTSVPAVTPTFKAAGTAPATTNAYNYSSGGNENLGFSTGGAKDIQNFRENIRNNYLPLPTDVTYEGLFYDYYFDTGTLEATDKLFAPSYSAAVSRDPISGETEYYLSVGLNSGLKESDFARKNLNLVVVLDISDSMNAPFNSYYYDGNNPVRNSEDGGKSKIAIARECVSALVGHLEEGDSFGMVLFNSSAYLAKPLRSIASTDVDAIQEHILGITAYGSTNLDAGMDMASGLLQEYRSDDPAKYENRIILLTDAEPNTGDTGRYSFIGAVAADAQNRIYYTFIGVGVDFNSNLIESITKTRGANYYSVHSSIEFKKRMNDEFDFMVTPLVFNLQLRLKSEGWEIEQVYGSPEADRATGELMKVNTLFPSKTEGGETKGGLVLLKLRRTGSDNKIVLRASYEDRAGKYDSSEVTIRLTDRQPEYFGNDGIRKGILLSRYADLLKTWMSDQRRYSYSSVEWSPSIDDHTGIYCPDRVFSQWERTSLPLTVSGSYRKIFSRFLDYFDKEAGRIGDNALDQEISILERLAG